MSKDVDFCDLWQLSDKYSKNIVGYYYKKWTRRCKNCFQKTIHKTAEGTGELIGNKIVEKIVA